MAESNGQNWVGRTIGPYQIEAQIGTSRWGAVYRALQPSLKRSVALKVLSPELAVHPHHIASFREEARLAAQIIHGQIAAVYEAGAAGGLHYCAMELMDGPSLDEFLRAGAAVDEHHLLVALADAAEALDFLWRRQIPHPVPTREHLLTNRAGRIKLIDVVPTDAAASLSPQEDLLSLGSLLAEIVNSISEVRRPIGELLEQMLGAPGRQPFASLADVVNAARALDRTLFPAAISAKPGTNTPTHKNRQTLIVLVIAGVAAAVATLLWLQPWRGPAVVRVPPLPPPPSDIETMVAIPAGEFIYQNGEKRSTNAYYIDKYEVTIGQYKRFLDAIAAGTVVPEHPFAGHKDHTPNFWKEIVQSIATRVPLNGVRLAWNSPIFAVDYYDAYSYAAWRGKRLPTDEEWEKAARGTDGRRYPWGATFDAAQLPVRGPWSLVYDFRGDRSPYGVIAMAGNVSEWIAQPPKAGRDAVVIRGGAWRDTEVELTQRVTDRAPTWRSDTLGFRCAADRDVK
jgi:formylglycine-generating enzyme required for sulfatase activity